MQSNNNCRKSIFNFPLTSTTIYHYYIIILKGVVTLERNIADEVDLIIALWKEIYTNKTLSRKAGEKKQLFFLSVVLPHKSIEQLFSLSILHLYRVENTRQTMQRRYRSHCFMLG